MVVCLLSQFSRIICVILVPYLNPSLGFSRGTLILSGLTLVSSDSFTPVKTVHYERREKV